jgi:hypothetical protein
MGHRTEKHADDGRATVPTMPDRLLRMLDHPFLARLQTALFVGTVLVPALALLGAGIIVAVIGVVTAVAWQLLVAPTIALFLILWWLFGLVYRRIRSKHEPPRQVQPDSEWEPRGSFVIGGPGATVRNSRISGSYSNSPSGFGGIYGETVENSTISGSVHDLPHKDASWLPATADDAIEQLRQQTRESDDDA